MSNVTTPPVKLEKTNGTTDAKHNGIDSHKKAATHHEAAAKHLTESVKHQEAGNHEKAALSTLKAQGHLANAQEHHDEIVKTHASHA